MKLSVVLATTLSIFGLASANPGGYEVWASDQSNSVAGQTSPGVKGSFLWIWDSEDIEAQLAGGSDAEPRPCHPDDAVGPCDLLDIFPQNLVESTTGSLLENLPAFGRLHGVIKDPQNRYVNANIFARGGGYVGVIDTITKEAVALFRATEFNVNGSPDRSVHMSFWNMDGSAIIVANLHGRAIERINVERDTDGTITQLTFDKSATLGLGKDQGVESEASFFIGDNAHGNAMLGEVTGSYDDADLQNLTPNSLCKENGCGEGLGDGGRGANLPICPIPSQDTDLLYTTLAGGGLLVVDSSETPMKIVGEYGNGVIYGAGCGGVQAKGKMHINSGVSASGAGETQSMFTVWQLSDNDYDSTPNSPNKPAPVVIFEDDSNTATGGNVKGEMENTSGQLPGESTRRDSHGTAATVDGSYIHVVDRIQNVVESFDVLSFKRVTYDLTSKSGKSGLNGQPGACAAKSVTDDSGLSINDPAPDLHEATPDGKYLMIALRGPVPVSVSHSAQGSCPGVGIVELLPNGKSGRLVGVLRSTNTIDTVPVPNIAGGHQYTGAERSDVHGAIVVSKA